MIILRINYNDLRIIIIIAIIPIDIIIIINKLCSQTLLIWDRDPENTIHTVKYEPPPAPPLYNCIRHT